MSTDPSTAIVNILDKDYQVVCPPEQKEELEAAASYLDEQMRQIRATGKVVGLERIAVMAALNISHELIQCQRKAPKAGAKPQGKDADTLKKLNNKLDNALQKYRQLEL